MLTIFPIIFVFFLFYTKKSSIICKNDIPNKDIPNKEVDNFIINPEQIKTFYLSYDHINIFNFDDDSINNDNDNDNVDYLIVNIHSINCDIKIGEDSSKDIKIKYFKNDFYSLEVPSHNVNIEVIPLMDIIDGNYKYNYKYRKCPVTINTNYSKNDLILLNKSEPTIFYFNENITHYNILYEIQDLTIESFVTFLLSFNEKTEFVVQITNCNSEKKSFIINNSTNIFLNNTFLSNYNLNNCYLTISINYNQKEPILLTFKAIDKDSISMLEKNYINKGFITSETSFQKYYMDIYKGEEGEIILYNKGNKGKLSGTILAKEDSFLNINSLKYPKDEKGIKLSFNEHNSKLNFSFNQTKNCEKGCYLLITYYQDNLTNYPTVIGFEFTLLVRTWDDYDLSPEIINIPFNEYIFGCFEEDSITHHFYSLYIPNNTKKIIIQIEGNYFEGFIGGGKRKLITSKKMDDIKNLDITHSKMVIIFEKENLTEINIKNNYISLAFRPKDYFLNILSYYFFKILYQNETTDDNLIFNLDPNIGNICLPEKSKKNENNTFYYCYFMLQNKYNEFSLKYSVSTSYENKDIIIYYMKYIKNKDNPEIFSSYNFVNMNDYNDFENIKFILFKFEFYDNKTKTILLNFYNEKNETIYPQIYSSQIYPSFNINKNFTFSFDKEYSLIFSWINGSGLLDLLNARNPSQLRPARNFRGYSIGIPLNNIPKISLTGYSYFIYYLKLNYIGQNNGVDEVIYGESMNEIITSKQFPIFYYIKNNIKDSMYINFRIINYDYINNTINYDIEGYLLEQEYIRKKLKGEYIKLENPISGKYDIYSKSGFLNISQENNTDKYVLIKINGENLYNKNNISNIMVQIAPIYQNNNEYIMPINHFIRGSFNMTKDIKEITYLIQISKSYPNDNIDTLIEYSSNCEGLELTFKKKNSNNKFKINNYTNENGFRIYRFRNLSDDIYLYISKDNSNINNANFILRYYLSEEKAENKYKFNNSCKKYIIDLQNDTESIAFEFNNIEIIRNSNPLNESLKVNVDYKIYGFLFIEEDINKNESINTFAFISSKSSYNNKTFVNSNYKKFNISFYNISRNKFNFQMLIKVHVIIKDFFLNEQLLVYSLPIEIEELKKEEQKNYNILIYIGLIVLIIIIIIISLIIFYIMKKKNTELQEKVLAISFSSGISEESIDRQNTNTKKDEDYENTFI